MREMYHAHEDYASRVANFIDTAQDRVLLQTMNFDSVGDMAKIVSAAVKARRRDVDVRVVFDRYSYPSVGGQYGLQGLNKFKETLRALRAENVGLHVVGKKEVNPFAGRNHVKAVVSDDVVLMGGGINLTNVSFRTRDFMFRYDDPELADELFAQLPGAAAERPEDRIVHVSDDYKVLLDGGIKGESLIYDETCAMAEAAQKVWYVSKLAPDGRLLDILKTKQTEYWYNSFDSAANFDKLAIAIDTLKGKVANNYKGGDVLHAKFCVFENEEGDRSAVSGSHNFNSRGIKFGTQELAVVSFDPDVCQDLIDFAEALSIE